MEPNSFGVVKGASSPFLVAGWVEVQRQGGGDVETPLPCLWPSGASPAGDDFL